MKVAELEKKLVFKPKPVFDQISKKEKTELQKFAEEYIKFLSEVKTEREAVEFFVNKLEEKGFKENGEKKGFFTYRNKFLAVWNFGKNSVLEGLRIVVSHIDTPRLDLKLHPLFEEEGMAFLKTHYYGGIKKYHWVAKPLALHGIVVKKSGEVVKIVIGEKESEPVFTICDLLPHLARKVQGEKKLSEAIAGEKLNALAGGFPLERDSKEKKEVSKRVKLRVLQILNEKFGIKEEDFVSAEFCFVPAGKAREVGIDRAFVGGYGQDDRVCAFTSFKALLESETPAYTNLVIFMDREEIGSEGNASAKSRILEAVIYEILKKSGYEPTPDVFFKVMENTKAISADVTAGIDPNYIEVHDKLNDAKMGYGVVVSRYTGYGGKYSANEAHAEFVAWLLNLWEKHKVVCQVASMGKVDEGGGGTVAKFFASYGMDVVDVGPPVLSMHSPFEIVHKADLYMTFKAFKTFLKF
jgi:aspartyl aminopeptidase